MGWLEVIHIGQVGPEVPVAEGNHFGQSGAIPGARRGSLSHRHVVHAKAVHLPNQAITLKAGEDDAFGPYQTSDGRRHRTEEGCLIDPYITALRDCSLRGQAAVDPCAREVCRHDPSLR